MKTSFIPLIIGIIFLIIGIICLIWPNKIQEYAIRYSSQGLTKFNPFTGWITTKSYLVTVRIIGVAAIFIFVLAVVVFFKGQN